jgi:hypothetical protein
LGQVLQKWPAFDAAAHFTGSNGRVKVVAMTTVEQDEQFYRDTESVAFPKLSDEQLALLEPLGNRRRLHRGDFVLKAGQREFPLTISLEGELEAFETRDGVEQTLHTSQPRLIGKMESLAFADGCGS